MIDLSILRRLHEGNGHLRHPSRAELRAVEHLAERGFVDFHRSDRNPVPDDCPGRDDVALFAPLTDTGEWALRQR